MIPTLDELRARRLPLSGQALARTDFSNSTNGDYGNDHEGVMDVEHANLITSMVVGPEDLHKVVIDVDLPVSLVASSTPGHFHLFIDKAMPWPTYVALLEALAAAGIVEPGYLAAALRRGHTAVRLPWVRKPEVVPLPVMPTACRTCGHSPADHHKLRCEAEGCEHCNGWRCPTHDIVLCGCTYGGGPMPDKVTCTCIGLSHRNECPQWVLPL